MKKISFEELKDKDLYLDDDGKIIIKEKRKRQFLPEYDETYYYVFDFTVCSKTNHKTHLDTIIINKDLVFKTKEDAEEYAKYLKALNEYSHKFTKEELENTSIPKYSLSVGKDRVIYLGYAFVNNKILFKSGDDCELFIKEAGVDNIKSFMFDIWG